jgi:hypothetical protein
MSSITEQLPSQSCTETASSKIHEDIPRPTRTSILKHVHDNSLITLAHNFAYQASKRQANYQKFSASLLKNKTLLVPTRLALKRQRAAFKSPTLQYEPIQSETFQIELGNSNNIPSSEDHRIKSTSIHTNHTTPNDISLMYR